MNYPLISEYIEAIKSAEDNFEELSYLRPVLGDDGLPVMTSYGKVLCFEVLYKRAGRESKGLSSNYRRITGSRFTVSNRCKIFG